VMLELFERDHVGEPLGGHLADQRAFRPRARPCRVGFVILAPAPENGLTSSGSVDFRPSPFE
jgi:hypothetical protein